MINQLAANISWEHSCIIQWGLPQNMHFLLHRFRSLKASTKEAFDLNALTMAFCKNTASIPIKCFKATHSGIFRRYEKSDFFRVQDGEEMTNQALPIDYKIAKYKIYALS